MEIKYCKFCGASLGFARANKKYCNDCKRKVNYKKHKERKESGQLGHLKTIPCEWCGKPLEQKSPQQKYHTECAYFARIEKTKKANAARRKEKPKVKKVERPKKQKKEKILSVAEVQKIADKLGLSYAIVSWKLSTGELRREDFK